MPAANATSAAAHATPRREATVAALQACLALAVALLLLIPGTRRTFVVRHAAAPEIVALFGDAWRRPIGNLRVTGGRIDGGRVHVYFAGPNRDASMTLRRADSPPAGEDDETLIQQPGNDIVAGLVCEPACDEESLGHLRALAERVLAGNPRRFWVPAWGFAAGRERRVALGLALALCLGALAAAGAALRHSGVPKRSGLVDMLSAGALTLLVTLCLGHPSVANWYAHNLPATGGILDADDRNGIAGFLLQAAVRAFLPWTDATLFHLNLLLHAAAGAVYFAAFRALAVDRATAWAGILLWSLLPMSVRIGWSDTVHVQVDLLSALLLLVWLRAQEDRNAPERVLAPLLAALLPLVRLEAFVLAPLPLLFGLLTGNRRPARRLRDALAYTSWLATAVVAVLVLFLQRDDSVLPDLGARARAMLAPLPLLAVLRQFVAVNSGLENWFPAPVTALLVAGVAVLVRRRPALLAAVVAAFFGPQLVLERSFNSEGIVGARYFLPLLALLALVAAHGLAALAAVTRAVVTPGLGAALARRSAYGMAALVALSVVPVSARLYRHEYAFQGEYRFLRRALATAPASARLLHLPVREDDSIRADPDCCLDPPNSPLALAFPRLRFEAVPIALDRAHLPADVDEHTYYYEGALCRLAETPSTENRNPGLSARVHRLCASLALDPRLEAVDSATVPSSGFWPFLEPGGVPLRLFRIRPQLPGH